MQSENFTPNNTNNTVRELKGAERSLLISLAVVVLVVAIVAIVGFLCINKPQEYVEGQVEGTTVRVAGKMAGRIEHLYVKEGDTVHAGDTLVHIHSTIAEAQLASARAMEEVARAQNRKVDAGARSQVIQAAADMVATARAAVDITQKTYERMENLFAQGVVTAQKRDEAKAAYDAAKAQLSAAESQYSLALSGAQVEDKDAARALVTAAGGNVEAASAVFEDSYLTAPCDGTIDEIYPEVGELVAVGTPIINVLSTKRWITFNVREEMLPDFKMGQTLSVFLPGLGKENNERTVEVYYIRDMGNYATWRATKSTGQYDSRTFQIKARPVDNTSAQDLRPGMTAIYKD